MFKFCQWRSLFPTPQIGHHKTRGVPNLVRKVAVRFDAAQTDVEIVAGRAQRQQGEAERIGAELVNDLHRIERVAQRLAELAAMLVAHQAVQIHSMERRLPGHLQAEHDHTRHPEEQDVVTGLHHARRIERLEVGRFIWPAQCAERPQARRKPRVQHIRVLLDMRAMALGALGRIEARGPFVLALAARPHRNAMAPPQLAADAPILDALRVHPVEVDLLEALRDDLDATILHSPISFLGQRLDRHVPLGRDHRLDDLAAALRAWNAGVVWLGLERQPRRFHIGPEFLARFKAIEPGVGPTVFVDLRFRREDVDDRQTVAQGDIVVHWIVARRDLQRAAAKLPIDLLIPDDRNFPIDDRHDGGLADELVISIVFRVHRYSRIAQDRFGADRRHRQITVRAFDEVFEVVQRGIFFAVFHLDVGHGGFEAGRPVDQACAAIDQALIVQAHEGFTHGAAQTFVEREALAIPIARCAKAADLRLNDAAVFRFPVPHALDELFTAQIVFVDPL